MKRFSKLLVLVTFLLGWVLPSWSQAPSTEGRDFWVTFLRAADDSPTELKLTISARVGCDVLIENTNTGYSLKRTVGDNSSTQLLMDRANCYSSKNESATYTALHVTATKDISLFAGNYRDKSFDATNVLPTTSLLDDYLIQTYPPSDHENKPQGSHFAIIAVEDGETVVDYTLPDGVQTDGAKKGSQTATLKKGQVWYVWTGKNEGDAADLSGTTVKARNGKKIAVFQGCPHTNIPYTVRDRDHIVSQAMPTAYWGTEFGITASRHHRRDIIAVMALNDGTKVYINDEKGNRELVHTFDFNTDKKHYWTFEIGDSLAYCADKEGESPSHGKLPYPLVIDSSCYLTTSCPAGVHLFMVSNRYDNAVEKVSSDTLVSDPAMLWISPIEQVIKEINFATYQTAQAKFHYMNILTTTGNVPSMEWNGNSIKQYFRRLRGNSDYSFARIEIPEGNHNLKGDLGFLAHVYGYGQRESYAYSCGSSTVQRSISFNDDPLLIDSISTKIFCLDQDIEMKLNIGNNEYEDVIWDFGDGTTFSPDPDANNNEKKKAVHSYSSPGWYDLKVTAVYINSCTLKEHTETMRLSFLVKRPDTVIVEPMKICLTPYQQDSIIQVKGQEKGKAYLDSLVANPQKVILNPDTLCYADRRMSVVTYGLETVLELDPIEGWDSVQVNDTTYYLDKEPYLPDDGVITWIEKNANRYGCDRHVSRKASIVTCLDIDFQKDPEPACYRDELLPISYKKYKGEIKEEKAIFSVAGLSFRKEIEIIDNDTIYLPIADLPGPGKYTGIISVTDAYNCPDKDKEFTFNITVYYPADIFVQKFNNVLAIYAPGNGGNKGYTFTAYQWYRDNQPIEGATGAVYHSEQPLDGLYHVVLTNTQGETLPSCEQEVYGKSYMPSKAPAAQKKIVNQRICIVIDNRAYDVYGQRVE